jgi:hypothetical protein
MWQQVLVESNKLINANSTLLAGKDTAAAGVILN